MNATSIPPDYTEAGVERFSQIGWRLNPTTSRASEMTITAPPAYENPIEKPSASADSIFAKTKLTTGEKKVYPFVAVNDLRGHIKLLKIFHTLRNQVRECTTVPDDENALLTGEAAWDVFLARATWRFELWITKVLNGLPEEAISPSTLFEHSFKGEEMPPLDVCLIWHTYSLVSYKIYMMSSSFNPSAHYYFKREPEDLFRGRYEVASKPAQARVCKIVTVTSRI